MQLYVMRHGIAGEAQEWPGRDFDRPLTPEGFDKTQRIVDTLKADGRLKVAAIWSSPLKRALQTAQITASTLGAPLEIVEELASGTRLRRIQEAFKEKRPTSDPLMLVGHEPDCGEIIAELIGDSPGDYALRKAGIALLSGEFEPGGMKLEWLLTPKEILKE